MKFEGRFVKTFGVVVAASMEVAYAQTPKPVPPAAAPVSGSARKSDAPPAFTLKVNAQHVASLDAKEIKASEIGKALSEQMKVPVRMSNLVAARTVTLKLSQVPVENILLALAPQVYIDYETRWGLGHEAWIGVELTGFNEREPRTIVEPRAFMVLAGNTEDEDVTPESLARDQAKADEEKLKADPAPEGPVLDVAVKDGFVSVRARRQQAAAVILEIASKGGMGFETRGELDPVVIDLDVRSMPIEQLPEAIARPGFGVLMRRNLTTGATRGVAVLLGTEATHIPKEPAKREGK